LGIVSAGFLHDSADQPAWFRVIAGVVSPPSGAASSVTGIVYAIVGIAFFNFAPVVYLTYATDLPGVVVDLACFLLQGILLVTVWRAIARTRARDRRG
jgi:hypothetical protein